MLYKKIKIASLTLLTSLFVACGGGGSSHSPAPTPSDNSINISGKAIDGYLNGATVTLKNGTQSIESNTTLSDGSWHINGVELDESAYLEISGGTDTATGEAFKSGMKLKHLIDTSLTSYNVTPLTTLVTEVVTNTTGSTKSSIEAKIATQLGLGSDANAISLLNSDPISKLTSDTQNAQKLIKLMLVIQKYAESYDSIASTDKGNKANGLLQIATQLNNNESLANTIANVSNMVTDTNAKSALNKLYQTLNDINESAITNTSSLNNVSNAIEASTRSLESNLASGSYTSALTNANNINLNHAIAQEEQDDNLTNSISNGYYETVLEYTANSDEQFTVNLPQGSFYIIAEPASSNLLTQIELDNNITDGNETNVTGSTITSINLRTASSGTAKIKITNNTSDIKKYVIPVRAYQSTSNIPQSSNIWIGAMNTDSSEINTSKNFTLDLNDPTKNIGLVLSEDESTHNWNFESKSLNNGTYTINVSTDYENNKNPLRYFSITLKENSKIIGTKYTSNASASLNVPIETNKNYTLEVRITGGEIPAAKADSLGYYKIELTQ